MNADNWLWPILGSKVGQSVPIGMKLELDVSHHPLDVYAKFQTDISQHVQKKSGKLFKKRNLCREVYSRPPVYQIWRIYLDLWGHDCKKWVWPTFGCKLGQSDPIVMQLKLDMSCHLLNVYTKFQIDISKHVEEKSGKCGRTDGRTDGHCHDIIRSFFKRAYKKDQLIVA